MCGGGDSSIFERFLLGGIRFILRFIYIICPWHSCMNYAERSGNVHSERTHFADLHIQVLVLLIKNVNNS